MGASMGGAILTLPAMPDWLAEAARTLI